MQKKLIPIIIVIALVFIGLGIYVSASRNLTPTQIMGDAYAAASSNANDPVVATYKDEQITQSVVDYEKQNLTVMQGKTSVTDEQALNQLLQNLAMLDEAERLGLSVTQEEVEYELNGQRKIYEDNEGVREIVDDFCENAGITLEQYYASMEEQLPRTILRQKLRDALGLEYCKEHGLEFTKINPPQEMLDYVDNYLNGLLDTYRADITYYQDLETQ